MTAPRWLKRTLGIALGVLGLAVLALFVWWSVAGEAFLYGAIFPDNARLREGQTVPDALDAAAFRADLGFLRRELPRLHVAFEEAFGSERLAARIAGLEAAADELTSLQRQLELIGLLAAGGQGTGHTMIVPLQLPLGWRIYPLSAYLFDDGLYVTAAADAYRSAIGSRITSIGGRPAEEALARLARYVPSDNEHSRRDNLPLIFSLAEPWIALGLAAEDGSLALDLDGDGPATLEVEPVGLDSLAGLSWARRTQTPVEAAWSPGDTRRRARPYTLERGPDPATLTLRLNAMANDEAEPIAALADRLAAMAEEATVERFVIDLRANSGGNNELAKPLLERICGHPVLDRQGVLYVLIGRRTFSAAAAMVGGLERRSRATFVGEPTGFATLHYGDARPILLPGSKLAARIASRRWREDLPGVSRVAIEPHLPAPVLARHHFADEDPAGEAIRRHQEELAAARASGHGTRSPAAVPADRLGAYLATPHHRVRIYETATGDGDGSGERGVRLAIDAVGPFADTELYGEGPVHPTGIRDVALELVEGEPARLHWKGKVFPLYAVEPDHRLPFERLEAGEIEAGVAAYRAATGDGLLDSTHELALNAIGYDLLRAGRIAEALELFVLGTELFPVVANSWDSLGDGLHAAGDLEGAREAYRRSLSLDPLWENSLRRLRELEGDAAPGG